jgi:hypothetical protein
MKEDLPWRDTRSLRGARSILLAGIYKCHLLYIHLINYLAVLKSYTAKQNYINRARYSLLQKDNNIILVPR